MDDDAPRRRSARLRDFDYSKAGCYLITVCTVGRRRLLGRVRSGKMELSEFGRIVAGSWEELPSHFPRVSLDAWVVMPDHFHGIVLIDTPLPTTCDVPPLTRATRASPLQPSWSVPPVEATHASPQQNDANAICRGDACVARCAPAPVGSNVPRHTASAAPRFPTTAESTGPRGPARGSLGAIVGSFKSATSRRINIARASPGQPVWQRGYHDRVIRSVDGLDEVRSYISANPSKWAASGRYRQS